MKNAFLIILLSVFLTACSTSTDSQGSDRNTDQITSFEECVQAGNPVMESYPRQCNHEGKTFVEEIEDDNFGDLTPCDQDPQKPGCMLDDSLGDEVRPCTREFRPVCGEVEIQCITTPCDPLKTTFSNRCEAENADAKNITEGECVDEEPNFEGACLSFDGNWLEEFQQCEGMAEGQCKNLGGTYDECASACRNDPDAQLCTLQCVQVCQF